jgi:hypothetical protein
LSLGVDAGTQGIDYRFGDGYNFNADVKLIPPAIEAPQESTVPVEELRHAPVAFRPAKDGGLF